MTAERKAGLGSGVSPGKLPRQLRSGLLERAYAAPSRPPAGERGGARAEELI